MQSRQKKQVPDRTSVRAKTNELELERAVWQACALLELYSEKLVSYNMENGGDVNGSIGAGFNEMTLMTVHQLHNACYEVA